MCGTHVADDKDDEEAAAEDRDDEVYPEVT